MGWRGTSGVLLGLGVAARMAVAHAEPALRVSSMAPEGSPWAVGIAEMASQLRDRTGGRLDVRSLAGGVAGDEVDTARACGRGKGFMWGGSAGAFAQVVPELNALELPFLFEDTGQVDSALGPRAVALLGRAFERHGLLLVPELTEVGWRSFAGPKALRTPGDLQGLRVRSQESPIHLEMWRALGAIPRVISVIETIDALQAHIVEAFDQSPVFMFATSWYQHARVYTLSQHMYQPGLLVVCKGAFDGLSTADRKLVVEIAAASLRRTRKAVRSLTEQVMAELATQKLAIVSLSTAERAALHQRTLGVREAFRRSTTPTGRELLEAIQAVTGRR